VSLKQQTLKAVDYFASCAFAFNSKMPSYFYGEWLWLSKRSWTSIYLRYEANTARIISTNLNLGDTFWDVGANIGLFSLYASKIVGPTGKVVSFEPAPETFELLSANVRGCETIQALPYGIGNENSNTLMSVQGASTGASFVKEVVELSQIYHKDTPLIQVPVSIYKMDTLPGKINSRPNLIKIDIEGFEVEALRGAENILDEFRPILVIEIHPLQLSMCGSHENEVFDLLRRHDYDCEVFNRDEKWALFSIIARPRQPALRSSGGVH